MRRKKSAEIFKHELVNYGSTNQEIDVNVLGHFFNMVLFCENYKKLLIIKHGINTVHKFDIIGIRIKLPES